MHLRRASQRLRRGVASRNFRLTGSLQAHITAIPPVIEDRFVSMQTEVARLQSCTGYRALLECPTEVRGQLEFRMAQCMFW